MTRNNFKVQLIQEGLKWQGYSPGPIDGLWGALTDAAFESCGKGKTWLIQFALLKREWKLNLDGSWGPQTEEVFEKAFSRASGAIVIEPTTPSLTLARILRGEVGVREVGTNSGKRIREYQTATDLRPLGPWAWCAAFVCWGVCEMLTECFPNGRHPGERPMTAGAWDFERWARENPELVELIKPVGPAILEGDILVFTRSHIGVANERSFPRHPGSIIKTIEGNTNAGGSREGDGVYLRERRKDFVRSVIRWKI